MQTDLTASINQSGFLPLSQGNVFLHTQVAKTTSATILLPPFAEEMNKTRHLLSATMRGLAAAGQSCFMLDNYGTGDSAGDLDSASAVIWREDLLALLKVLKAEGYQQLSFIAVRFGALQLFDLLNQPELPLPVTRLILWQPMFDVTKFWQQFARIKVAEAMATGVKLSQAELEQQLLAGEAVEIAGYPISQAFYQSLPELQSAIPPQLAQCQLSWFETSQLDAVGLPVQKKLEQLQQVTAVNFVQLKAEPYWQTTELARADELIALTIEQFSRGDA
ncbi:glycosyl transferase [Rheinheimera sp. FR7-31]|uniref:glycosyl transferase n=1 Tax=Rheinheimera fenheensis TaxID=3152295 RepID=UPI00325EE99B